MHKIIEILNLDRTPKTEAMERWKSRHSLYGNFYDGYEPKIGQCMWFVYENETTALKSSTVQRIDKYDDIVQVTTMNSIYIFKEVKKNEQQ